MAQTIRARFSHGVIEPLEKIELAEGEELTVTVENSTKEEEGHWAGLAMSNFANDWENKKDAVYDNWKEIYNVQ